MVSLELACVVFLHLRFFYIALDLVCWRSLKKGQVATAMVRPTFETTIPFGGRELRVQLDSLVDRIRKRQLIGSWHIALETVLLCRHLVSASRWTAAPDLLCNLRTTGRLLTDALPQELVIGNIIRRVMRLVREEDHNLQHGSIVSHDGTHRKLATSGMTSAVLQLFDPHSASLIAQERSPISTPQRRPASDDESDGEDSNVGSDEYNTTHSNVQSAHQLKPAVIQAIQELLDELETVYSSVAERAMDHVHSK